MASATEYGAIAGVVSLVIIGGFALNQARDYFFPDVVKARYEKIDRECARPRPDGGQRQIVVVDANGGYVPCLDYTGPVPGQR